MHVSELLNEISKENNGIFTDEQSLRTFCQRFEEIISFSRTSTYGLKKWEDEKEGIKGGSIRKIVEEYLQEFNEPIHISKITEQVLKYRDTYKRSILDNLKLDKDIFCFFKNEYVGLKSKNYNKDHQLELFS